VAAHPGNAKAHYNYGNWLREEGGDSEAAERHYREALRWVKRNSRSSRGRRDAFPSAF